LTVLAGREEVDGVSWLLVIMGDLNFALVVFADAVMVDEFWY
jgi:uncharacterized membrane protein YuzA (DUF378 family)